MLSHLPQLHNGYVSVVARQGIVNCGAVAALQKTRSHTEPVRFHHDEIPLVAGPAHILNVRQHLNNTYGWQALPGNSDKVVRAETSPLGIFLVSLVVPITSEAS